MKHRVHNSPNLIYSVGTQVVTLKQVQASNGKAVHPAGAVGGYHAAPREFGLVLFRDYGLAVEVVSFQLLFAAVGAFYVGKSDWKRRRRPGRS